MTNNNYEIIEKIPRTAKYKGAMVLTIPYKTSLTIVDSLNQKESSMGLKIKPIYNHPKNQAILEDKFQNQGLTLPAYRLAIPNTGSVQETTQLFKPKRVYTLVIDGKLFELYGDNYMVKNSIQETVCAINPIEATNQSKVRMLTRQRLGKFCFPEEDGRLVLVMDKEGNIYQNINEIIPNKGILDDMYKAYCDYLEKQIILNRNMSYSFISDKPLNPQTTDNKFLFDIENLSDGMSVFKDLLLVESLPDNSLHLTNLDINYFGNDKFLVRGFKLPVITYNGEALKLLNAKMNAPVKTYYKK